MLPMTNKSLAVLRWSLALFLVFSLSLAFGQSERQNWEYKVLVIPSQPDGPFSNSLSVPAAGLNALGADGWELVSACVDHGTKQVKMNPSTGVKDPKMDQMVPFIHPQSMILIFKRPIIKPILPAMHPIIRH